MVSNPLPIEEALADFCRDPWVDPAPFYQRLHHEAPVIKGPRGVWVVSRYADANIVSREQTAKWSRESDGSLVGLFADGQIRPAQTLMNFMMGFRGMADHDRMRDLVSQAFSARAVAALEGRIGEIVDGMIDAALAKGSMDLVQEFAYPLPVIVISEMFGIPEQDRHLLGETAAAIVAFGDVNATERERAHADDMALRFTDMIERQVEKRRQQPGTDLLTGLVEAEQAGDRLSAQELVSVCFELTAAGHETTATLISNLVYTLLKDRELWEELRARPNLVPSAIEECLRYESPLRVITPRWPDRDVELGGTVIPAGEKVSVWVAAANRDIEVFDEPDTFRLDRGKSRHHAFSAGPHFCLGAALGRLEARVAMNALVGRLPNLKLAESTAHWRSSLRVRGLSTLPVKCA